MPPTDIPQAACIRASPHVGGCAAGMPTSSAMARRSELRDLRPFRTEGALMRDALWAEVASHLWPSSAEARETSQRSRS